MIDAVIVPHDPDQTVLGLTPVDATFAPLAVNLTISLHRTPRQKCSSCGKRRIGFFVGLSDLIASAPLCAKCAGIR